MSVTVTVAATVKCYCCLMVVRFGAVGGFNELPSM